MCNVWKLEKSSVQIESLEGVWDVPVGEKEEMKMLFNANPATQDFSTSWVEELSFKNHSVLILTAKPFEARAEINRLILELNVLGSATESQVRELIKAVDPRTLWVKRNRSRLMRTGV